MSDSCQNKNSHKKDGHSKPARTKTNAVQSPMAGIIDRRGQGPKNDNKKETEETKIF